MSTEKKKKCDSETNFRASVMPLKQYLVRTRFARNTLVAAMKKRAIAQDATKEEKNKLGLISGFESSSKSLEKVYFQLGSKKKQILIGLIKATQTHGTTSITQGAAKIAFEHPDCAGLEFIAFLNCGTGGVKIQVTRKDPKTGIISMYAESKDSGSADLANPNALRILDYVPSENMNIGEVDFFKDTEKLKKSVNKFLTEELKLSEDLPIYVLVTGTLRQSFEKAPSTGKNSKSDYDNEMEKYFAILYNARPFTSLLPSPDGKTPRWNWFVTQEEEGILEFYGGMSMYKNLCSSNLLDPVELLGSLGIGKGSTQWMLNLFNKLKLIGAKVGMIDPKKLTDELPNAVEKQFLVLRDEFLEAIGDRNYVIALKSGATLLIESEPELKKLLLTPLTTEEEEMPFLLEENDAQVVNTVQTASA